jgi:hypothetical protein
MKILEVSCAVALCRNVSPYHPAKLFVPKQRRYKFSKFKQLHKTNSAYCYTFSTKLLPLVTALQAGPSGRAVFGRSPVEIVITLPEEVLPTVAHRCV